MSDPWIGLIGVAIGALIGFAGNWLTERSRRTHADSHRFEAEKRAAYVRLLEEVARFERQIRDREVERSARREIRRRMPNLAVPRDTTAIWDFSTMEMAIAEVALLGRMHVEMQATMLGFRVRDLAYASDHAHAADLDGQAGDSPRPDPGDEAWHAASNALIEARTAFIRAAKRDLDLPSGVMSKWQSRRWRLKQRLRLAPRSKKTPSRPAGSDKSGAGQARDHETLGGVWAASDLAASADQPNAARLDPGHQGRQVD
jgi:hypothetical protein